HRRPERARAARAARRAGPLHSRASYFPRARRVVLAPGRRDLDLCLAVDVPAKMTDLTPEPAQPAESGRAYVLAWLALLGLTLLSFGAHFLELGALATAVSLAIA